MKSTVRGLESWPLMCMSLLQWSGTDPFEPKHAHQLPVKLILQGSDSALPMSPGTKKEVVILLLGCNPPTTPSMSPGVLACLLQALDSVLGDTAKCLATAHIDVPSWKNSTTLATLVDD